MQRDCFTLDNGLRVIVENMPERRSANIALWQPVGSRIEQPGEYGYAHFLEHMLFKGTEKRNYRDISATVDRLGGHFNAATSKETTHYYIRLSSRHLNVAFDILSDLYYESTLPLNEFETEKGVILEEKAMVEDMPSEHIVELFTEQFYGDNGVGRPIDGTHDSLAAADRDSLVNFYRRTYGPSTGILSIAGRVFDSESEKKQVYRDIENYFGRSSHSLQGDSINRSAVETPARPGEIKHIHKKIEQVHFILGLPGISESEPEPHAFHIFSQLLGGSMSSLLFSSLREERGLCYTVGSFMSQFLHEGIWGVYAATAAKNYNESVDLIIKEIQNVLDGRVPREQVEDVKTGFAGSLELAYESTGMRSAFNAASLIYYGRLLDLDEFIEKILNTTYDEVVSAPLNYWRDQSFHLTALGPVEKPQLTGSFNFC